MGDQDFTCGWSCCVGKIITQNKLTKAWKMSGGTLDGEVARAQVREAREARHAGLGAPSYHLVSQLWPRTIGRISPFGTPRLRPKNREVTSSSVHEKYYTWYTAVV